MIRESGVPVKDVADVTGFPEMLDGRLKTLHPRVAGGILAMRSRPDHMNALAEQEITPIDMVVVNLYRFEEVAAKAGARLEELIENIDIGGPTMIRGAAKNYQDVAVVVSPADYGAMLDEMKANGGSLSLETKWRLAKKAFRVTADYDTAIAARLAQDENSGPLPDLLNIRAPKMIGFVLGEFLLIYSENRDSHNNLGSCYF
jgi:phosphoribosylaminoimidazolecarboxamide formyltransferase/IMP cyclohydrolase